MRRLILWLGIAACGLNFFCSPSKISSNLTVEERFRIAKELFEDKHYLEAKTQFTIILLSSPGSAIADSAQFYLAESHYKLKEYVEAIAEYERLLKNYPNSPLVDDAQYKIGMCYFKRSPNYARDQENTHKAIKEFQRFLEDYPQSELVPEVEKKLFECRRKLAKKEFKIGELYRKMRDYKAAIIYFDSVLENYYDTEYAEKAQYWKAECLRKQGEYQRAKTEFETFIEKYPQSHLVSEAKRKLEDIKRNL